MRSLHSPSAYDSAGAPRLTGEVSNDVDGNVLTAFRKPPVKLEGFERNSKAEPSGTCLIAEQFMLVVGKCPMLAEFMRVPILFHELAPRAQIVRRRGHTPNFLGVYWVMAKLKPDLQGRRIRGQIEEANSLRNLARQTTRLWRKHHLPYDQTKHVVEQA